MTRKEKARLIKAALLFAAEIVKSRMESAPTYGLEVDKKHVQETVACLKSHADQAHYEVNATGKYPGIDKIENYMQGFD